MTITRSTFTQIDTAGFFRRNVSAALQSNCSNIALYRPSSVKPVIYGKYAR